VGGVGGELGWVWGPSGRETNLSGPKKHSNQATEGVAYQPRKGKQKVLCNGHGQALRWKRAAIGSATRVSLRVMGALEAPAKHFRQEGKGLPEAVKGVDRYKGRAKTCGVVAKKGCGRARQK
jgi:hypothetical protein